MISIDSFDVKSPIRKLDKVIFRQHPLFTTKWIPLAEIHLQDKNKYRIKRINKFKKINTTNTIWYDYC